MDIHLLPRKKHQKLKEKDSYILANKGVGAAMLADSLGVTERFVTMRQRKLNLRKCLHTLRKGESHEA